MIIVTGRIRGRPESMDELVALSLDHVHRSREEPGCLLHSVHRDAEDPLALVFVEQWTDRDALAAHFAVPASRAFVRAAAALTTEPPTMAVYDARPIQI